MRQHFAGAVLLVLAVASCRAPGQPSTSTSGATMRKPIPLRAAGAASPRAGTPASPGQEALDAIPEATPGPLRAPAGAERLAGTLRVDAAYLLAAGGRQVGAAVAPPGAGPEGGFGVLANNGAALISDKGVGLIGNNGGTLVSDAGTGLIGKTKFRLGFGVAQVEPPAPGALRPAAGMWVGLASLATGRALPIGEDDAGHPVFTVATGADGGFAVYLPPGHPDNVGLVAVPPAGEDPRLAYGFVVPGHAAAGVALGEDQALATSLLRTLLVARLQADFLSADAAFQAPPADDANQQALYASFGPLSERLRLAAKGAGFDALGPAGRQRVRQRFADAALAQVDLAAVRLGDAAALDEIAAAMAAIRAAAGARLARDPRAFDAAPWLAAANARRAARGEAPFAVLRASDVGELVVREQLHAEKRAAEAEMAALLADLGLDPALRTRLKDAGAALFVAIALPLVTDAATEARLTAAIEGAIAAERGS